ncbi:MAG: hypothetical protein ACREFF_14565, partial [Candidatus Udaeobacter sp.]
MKSDLAIIEARLAAHYRQRKEERRACGAIDRFRNRYRDALIFRATQAIMAKFGAKRAEKRWLLSFKSEDEFMRAFRCEMDNTLREFAIRQIGTKSARISDYEGLITDAAKNNDVAFLSRIARAAVRGANPIFDEIDLAILSFWDGFEFMFSGADSIPGAG